MALLCNEADPGRGRAQTGFMTRSLTSCLFCAARLSATGRAVRHRRVGHRILNIAKGRALGRLGFWRRLWG